MVSHPEDHSIHVVALRALNHAECGHCLNIILFFVIVTVRNMNVKVDKMLKVCFMLISPVSVYTQQCVLWY